MTFHMWVLLCFNMIQFLFAVHFETLFEPTDQHGRHRGGRSVFPRSFWRIGFQQGRLRANCRKIRRKAPFAHQVLHLKQILNKITITVGGFLNEICC
jgi:lipid-A-disaccharide synthase-like uncharacterized protein